MKDATDPGPASHEEPAPEATLPAGAEAAEPADSPLPKALSFGWPDESIWSQSYEWKPMQPKDPPPSRSPETDPARAGVSDIVAQVRAELGISDGMLRLSAGLEAWTDLAADVDAALRASNIA